MITKKFDKRLVSTRSKCLGSLISVLLIGNGTASYAQNVASISDIPENSGVGGAITGNFQETIPLVSIGGASDGLSHSVSLIGQTSRSFSNRGEINIETAAVDGTYSYNVLMPGSSRMRFLANTSSPTSSTSFSEFQLSGHSLSYNGTNFILTSRNGTIATFEMQPSGSARIKTVLPPNGNLHTYTYSGSALAAVSNATGYMMKYQVGSPSSMVIGINLKSEYCSPSANTCSVASHWPRGEGGPVSSELEDAEGRVYNTGYVGGYTVLNYPGGGAYSSAGFSGSGDLFSTNKNGLETSYSISETGPTGNKIRTVTASHQSGGGSETTTLKVRGNLVTSVDDVLGQTTSYVYNSDNLVDTVTYPLGDFVSYTYDDRGNVTQTVRTAGPGGGGTLTSSAFYPATCTTSNQKYCNKPTYTIDTLGNRTDYSYHAASGNISLIQAPNVPGLGRAKAHFEYAQYRAKLLNGSGSYVNGAPIWKLYRSKQYYGTPQQVQTTYQYNVWGNLNPSSVSRNAGGITLTTTSEYDKYGNLIKIDGPLPGTSDVAVTFYDKLQRVTGSIGGDVDGGGSILRSASKATYDILGVVTKVETGTATGFALSNLNSMSVLESTHSVLDNIGRPITSYLKVGSSVVSQQDRKYDGRGRVECAALRMNPTTINGSYSDACSLSAASVFGPDRITKRTYDVANRVTASTSAFGTSAATTILSEYYAHGPIKFIWDGEGNRTYFKYDGFNRSTYTYFPHTNGSGNNWGDYTRHDYDSNGRHHQTRRRDGTVTSWTQDQLGRKTYINAPGTADDTTLTYNITGALQTISKPGQSLSYAYDNAGRLMSETSSLGAVSYLYDNYGRRTRMDYPGSDGFYVTYEYTSGGALTAIKEKGSSALVSYAYDSRGRRKTVTRGSSNKVTTYNYDAQSRLSSMSNNLAGTSADQTTSFAYTPSGQIASQTNSNAAFEPTITDYTADFVINGLNQIFSQNGASFTYDASGNMKTGGGNSFNYDSLNRLTSVSGKGALTYDPVFRLKSLTASGATTNFLYDGQDMIAEYNGSTLSKRYVHGPSTDEPLVEYLGSGTTSKIWLIPDVRGSIVTRANSAGTSLGINTYDAYGQPDAGNEGRFQYTGQVWLEELDLYYYKARFYDPTIRRFLNADPTGYGDGLNMYAYVGGDPINMTDPTGLAGIPRTVTCGRSGGRDPKTGGTSDSGVMCWTSGGGYRGAVSVRVGNGAIGASYTDPGGSGGRTGSGGGQVANQCSTRGKPSLGPDNRLSVGNFDFIENPNLQQDMLSGNPKITLGRLEADVSGFIDVRLQCSYCDGSSSSISVLVDVRQNPARVGFNVNTWNGAFAHAKRHRGAKAGIALGTAYNHRDNISQALDIAKTAYEKNLLGYMKDSPENFCNALKR